MGFLAALPTLVPEGVKLVEDIVTAIKDGAKSTSSQHDAPNPTGKTAAAIANDNNFQNAVKNKQTSNAANAAAASVPSSTVQKGASISLSASGNLAKNLSAQLKAVVNAIDPCYQAEDAVYAIRQVIAKPKIDAYDQTMLTDLWTSADQNISAILGTTKNQFAELGDPGAIAAFGAIATFSKSPDHAELDTWLKKPALSAPEGLQLSVNSLWFSLNTATIVGKTTLSQIASGLDLIPQVEPPVDLSSAASVATQAAVAAQGGVATQAAVAAQPPESRTETSQG